MSKEDLIKKIEENDFTLSFSAIKAFSKSPYHFIEYKLGARIETAAMKKGTLIHCAILEPDQLEKRYAIMKTEELPNPDSDFRNAANREFKKMFEAKAESENKIIITPIEWELALAHKELCYTNEVVAPYLTGLKYTESQKSWEFGGFKWRGVIDGVSKTYLLDLKTVADANPLRTKWKCDEEKYHWQAYLYKKSEAYFGFYNYFNLLVDGEMGLSLHRISETKLMQAHSEMNKILDKFKQCIDNNLWHHNYEFWAESTKGYFVIQ